MCSQHGQLPPGVSKIVGIELAPQAAKGKPSPLRRDRWSDRDPPVLTPLLLLSNRRCVPACARAAAAWASSRHDVGPGACRGDPLSRRLIRHRAMPGVRPPTRVAVRSVYRRLGRLGSRSDRGMYPGAQGSLVVGFS